ncbi:uncharacterized protein F5891DRAFT_985339 [Suillus fuscotomentosus]|uniref:Uncharacterized protein n=1 Tax=Suillus fuscotomentosus TaxID=1912939 RepID=A0AAD4DWX0_9AGAM|nr:uncharacterized protein F5891DRAFT_985339 [Suillus fuscotomentosus]KAG1894108.1 hypothetical protein F5891DRAFT_985339 [Suillus fuscotomentosus]
MWDVDVGVDVDMGADLGVYEDEHAGVEAGYEEEVYDGAAKTYGIGTSFMKTFNSDEYAVERMDNPYFPFASKPDWEMAAFLLQSELSMTDINKYLHLEFTRKLPLSFRSSRELRGRAEMLLSPPRWKYQTVLTKFRTTKTLHVFYRDAIECLQLLLIYESAERAVRIYYGFMTGDRAWELQERLPDGATLLGVVLSSDKTKVSNLSGNRYTHPLLISLANINSEICGKGSLEAYIPLTLLPIAKFIHRNQCMRGILADRLFHQCIGIVVEPLEQAAHLGVMMSNPAGFSRYCCMPLIVAVANFVSPFELTAFFEECKQHFLNGVLTPFWLDWLTADPSSFLMPELLHHLHKMFWDHDLRWCIKVIGAKEINFRFALLQMCIGYRAFKEGISDLKQTLGQDHHNVQCYIIGIIANAAPAEFITAIRALIEFRYLAQAPWFTDEKLIEWDGSL